MKKTTLPLHLLLLVLIVTLTLPLAPLRAAASFDLPPTADPADGSLTLVGTEEINPFFTVETYALVDGTALDKAIINGPPQPPPGFEAERAESIASLPSRGVIPGFPSYNWVFGCSAVSAAMIAAYYDLNGYPNMYTGPTDGGVMPLTDTSWPTWKDGSNATYVSNPLVASKKGLDGRTSRGSIDNYWVSFLSEDDDPYITNTWDEHTWGTAVGDYMKTSQSAYDNVDGSTSFFNWVTLSVPLFCSDMPGLGIENRDGTYGRKLFYEARGYTVTDCFNQRTDNQVAGGFSLAQFQAEIDAGHPVLLNLVGHSIVGYGYSGSTVYIRDTWDSDPSNSFAMTWGGDYYSMQLHSVSIVRLSPSTTTPPFAPTGVEASQGTFADKVSVSWNASSGATYYQVFRNTGNTHTGEATLTSNHPASLFDDTSAVAGTTYYYWIKACNSAGCSGYSSVATGYRASTVTIPAALTGVSASQGTYADRVRVSWNAASGATYYQVFRNTGNTHTGQATLTSNHAASPFDDTSAVAGTTYYYWVKACNSAGCSGYSLPASGLRGKVYPIYLPLIFKN